ncbi:hypothetical protein CSOJ01_14618 [Colletotrichum sojae]|nr:hypothetical protein CSOJ01_14618 [Colletotrichum sojae]
MSGMEGLGATASVAQLVELCVKCGQTTARIIRSYRGAPKEIKEVAIKVETLKFRIEQVQGITDDLSGTELDDLLPEIHRDILLEQLQAHHQALLVIAGLSNGVGGQTKGARLQWALVDKRKTGRIMRDLAEVHATLDQILGIVSFDPGVAGQRITGQKSVVGDENGYKQPVRDYVDDLLMLWDQEPNQTLHNSSWAFGATVADDDKGNTPRSTEPCYSGRLSVTFTPYHRDFRASLRVKFFLLNERIFNFELGLRQAIAAESIPDILFSTEVCEANIDPVAEDENPDVYFRGHIPCGNRVDIASVAYEHCWKYSWTGPKEFGSLCDVVLSGVNITHWYLFADKACEMARSSFESSIFDGISSWANYWRKYSIRRKHRRKWNFQSAVTGGRHLLLHGADPSEITIVLGLSPESGYLRAHEVCKEWGLPQVEEPISPGSEGLRETAPPGVCAHPREHIRWSEDGLVWTTKYDDTSIRNGSIGGLKRPRTGDTTIEQSDRNNFDGSDGVAIDTLEDNHSGAESGLFASIVSTEEGRRQIRRVPLVKAYCCALQLAGYRAEMDDEGDIWYEDDDGDQYWDAAEHLEDLDRAGPFGGTCDICRDPVKYGLGYILDKCEDGLVEYQRGRQKFVDRGVLKEKEYVWPSWTRRGGRV